MTDEERIAKREEAVEQMTRLKSWRVLGLERTLVLHEECGGSGRKDGHRCTYCAGSGRVVKYVATTVVPYREERT